MKNLKFTLFLICALFSAGQVSAQQNISPEKKAMIQEILEITGVTNFRVELKLSSTDIGNALTGLVDGDKELTNAQKEELKKPAFEAKDRLEKILRDYMADTANSDKLYAETSAKVFDSNFTEAELQEMVAFFRTPSGRKAAKFIMGLDGKLSKAYSAAFTEKLREFMTIKLEIEMEQLKQKIKEVKTKKLEA
jgi:hypothetical protein